MSTLTYILIFSFIGSVFSLIGGVILLLTGKTAHRIAHPLASFAAGALLATAFFDLMPEAAELAEGAPHIDIFGWTLGGILIFFLFERFLRWFHHHHEHGNEEDWGRKPVVPLIILGDSLHNFIDGLAIAAAFLVDTRLGMVTALATAAHEIPQEIGDFGILLSHGVKRWRVLFYNFISALATMVAAVLAYYAGSAFTGILPIVLAVTAGFFIYIAASDLIPEIHNRDTKGFAFLETMLLMAGIGVVYLAIRFLEHGV